MRLFSPIVALINLIVRLILRPLGIKTDNAVEEALSNEELKSIVQSGGDDAENSEQQDMLLGVLELEDVIIGANTEPDRFFTNLLPPSTLDLYFIELD